MTTAVAVPLSVSMTIEQGAIESARVAEDQSTLAG